MKFCIVHIILVQSYYVFRSEIKIDMDIEIILFICYSVF